MSERKKIKIIYNKKTHTITKIYGDDIENPETIGDSATHQRIDEIVSLLGSTKIKTTIKHPVKKQTRKILKRQKTYNTE